MALFHRLSTGAVLPAIGPQQLPSSRRGLGLIPWRAHPDAGAASVARSTAPASKSIGGAAAAPFFGLKIAPDSIDAARGEVTGGASLSGDVAMGIGPHNKQDCLPLGVDNVLSPREENALDPLAKSSDWGDEFFDVLAPALEEAAGLPEGESRHKKTSDLVRLLEENARASKACGSVIEPPRRPPSNSRRRRHGGR